MLPATPQHFQQLWIHLLELLKAKPFKWGFILVTPLTTSDSLIVSVALPQHTEGFKKRWFTMDDRRLMYFKDPLVRRDLTVRPLLVPGLSTGRPVHPLCLCPRTPSPGARCSSAARRTATPSCPACPPPHRATTGTTASPSSRRTGSSCSPARPRPSNGIG